ncbi:hypothetical protein PHYSODRAFT_333601 [Phytophthora sojae]|uniref:Uncharacterized protein n=1 Tax=Phytophthora sojae (strain P6497) TaxID=1094619 RepID=G4ZMI7_PHYSP|nr:hypothetical protein PHYSODRAFT_333601 [Phytophthora sojae]EGZ15334.1 hypothetical protein PHYSODRAFT_333601 [Phytophthora sojae]|eukprot:XP_009529083.1 hypothetical protein PHYSODRAFT_333601 [Phytophthora sojae]
MDYRADAAAAKQAQEMPVLVKGLAIVAIAVMMCFAPTTATASVDVKENSPEKRKLYYVRTPITKSPYNRYIPPPPTPKP